MTRTTPAAAIAKARLSWSHQPASRAPPGGSTTPFCHAAATVSPLYGGSERVVRAGVERTLTERHRLGQADARFGDIDREGPAGAGGVPIELVEAGIEGDLARGAVADHVLVRPGIERAIRLPDPQADPVPQAPACARRRRRCSTRAWPSPPRARRARAPHRPSPSRPGSG